MTRITRRKPRKYKTRKVRVPKTSRRELKPAERSAIVCAVVIGHASYQEAADANPGLITKSGVAKLVKRIQRKAIDSGFAITDPLLYENELGRGRPEILSEEQKQRIISITTSDREHREKESWQAIKNSDFDNFIPRISISTFENVMYGAGYSRKRPGWKPPLSPEEVRKRYQWALKHNPDLYKKDDNLGFNFRDVCYSDETPARIGEQRGMQRSWIREGEQYRENVKKPRIQKYCQLQFYGIFTYNNKGPCIIYSKEDKEERWASEAALELENHQRRQKAVYAQKTARSALQEMGESEINSRKQQYTQKDDYTRGFKSRGGIDGYRHREMALKQVVPWMKSLKDSGRNPILLEDGAPAHQSRIANDFLDVNLINKLDWPGHSPEINAEEHAWPWIRRHITKDFAPSTCEDQCRSQWQAEWDSIPQEVINKWIDHVPITVRRIITHGGKNDFHDG